MRSRTFGLSVRDVSCQANHSLEQHGSGIRFACCMGYTVFLVLKASWGVCELRIRGSQWHSIKTTEVYFLFRVQVHAAHCCIHTEVERAFVRHIYSTILENPIGRVSDKKHLTCSIVVDSTRVPSRKKARCSTRYNRLYWIRDRRNGMV